MDGNNTAMMHLGVMTVKDPSLLPRTLLPVIFHHTSRTASRAAQYTEPLPPSIGPLAFAALDVLGRALLYPNQLRPSQAIKARHASLILEHIEGIWTWTRHFITTVVDIPLEELDLQVQVYVHSDLEHTVTRLLAAMMDHEPLCFRLLSYPDFMPALARLSVHVLDSRYRHQESSKSNMMNAFAYLQDKDSHLWRPQVAEEYQKLAHLSVPLFLKPFTGARRLNRELFLKGIAELITDLALFKNFYSSSRRMMGLLLKNDAARWLTHFTYRASCYAHYYSSDTVDVRKRATFITILFFPLEFLNDAIRYFGYAAIVQVLQNDFLPAAINCIINFVRIPKNPLPEQLMQLFDSISRYSIYLPVMKSLTRRRLIVDNSELKKCLNISRDPPDEGLRRALAGFLVVMESRRKVKTAFDRQSGGKFCENEMVGILFSGAS
ncbi:hypothetical protein D9758_017653 [Tetrapyrgos nigripes]|uniref:Uncharacterized protein n=1 Tax=Tetrapyrgos nigripes TaxID=182062 RepID=A0A8H5CHS4_9AGAR|nr:hypothetical protein D9758_017653 [Tetrapyrgos nigripes]